MFANLKSVLPTQKTSILLEGILSEILEQLPLFRCLMNSHVHLLGSVWYVDIENTR